MSAPVTIPLSKPITAHGEEVDEISLRKPTTEECIELGDYKLIIPSSDGQSAGVEVRKPVIARYVSRLAGIPMSSVKSLPYSDFLACEAVVVDFLQGGDGETPPS